LQNAGISSAEDEEVLWQKLVQSNTFPSAAAETCEVILFGPEGRRTFARYRGRVEA
jgi:hypothetical protein